jgi:hypothetical protein
MQLKRVVGEIERLSQLEGWSLWLKLLRSLEARVGFEPASFVSA